MNRLLIAACILSITFSSCNFLKNNKSGKGKDNGQIVSNKTSKGWTPVRPVDMVPVPSGSFVMGQTDYDFTQQSNAPIKTVSVSGFFIDETEVTNAKYKIFVEFVRDSITRWKLAEKAEELGLDPLTAQGGLGDYAFDKSQDPNGELTPYEQMIMEKSDGREDGYEEVRRLNWNTPLEWETDAYPDVDYAEVLESMYYAPDERFDEERLIDVRSLNYKTVWVDTEAAAKARGRGTRSEFVKEKIVNIYPDTTVWSRDFEYTYNEPMHENYFSHDSYIDYPVVGVTWDQANAYCDYKTKKHNGWLREKKKKKFSEVLKYRLPNETEWEYAARGGLQNAPFPWGGPHMMDEKACYLANFKPKRGDYIESKDDKTFGYLYTSPVKTYPPNQYGLYDMAGNVSEWTSSSYNNASYQASSTLNPSLGKYSNTLKTIRGGSWKDVGYLLMVSSRDYEEKDSARSFIGFRTVQTIPEGAKVRYRKVK